MKVLVVDDDGEHVLFLRDVIHGWGHQVETAQDGLQAIEKASTFLPHVIVTDLKMPRMDGFEFMEQLRANGADVPTIVLTAFGSIELAIKTVHDYGALWYLEKPVNTISLFALLGRAAEQGRLAQENQRLRMELAQRGVLGDLVGRSPEMQGIFALIRHVAPTNASVLITGESGTGKELVARAIHSFSPRSTEAFLAVNCAALPETLIETELFGHEKGAFTGALERRAGAIELAEGGTLFLDEIGEMPLQMQAKLLRVLEDFQFRRVGGKAEIAANVRLISATNRPPEKAIKEGKLREDLYYRLNVFRIEVPPLRERIDDIPLIAAAMIEKLNQKHSTRVTHLAPEAAEALKAHSWDGNVRELRNVIERGVILAGEGPLQESHLYLTPPLAPETRPANAPAIRVGMSLEEAERLLIEATVLETKNNKRRAAMTLGISSKTLHMKLKQYRSESEAEAGVKSGAATV